jgi:hypothetical protein
MTRTMDVPFLGPRTGVAVRGGWVVHVRRYLTVAKIQVAKKNLEKIMDAESRWCAEVNEKCALGVEDEGRELEMLENGLKEQEKELKVLEEVNGLDFGALDGGLEEGCRPIWKEMDGVELYTEVATKELPSTPLKQTMLPTPPTTETKTPVPRLLLGSALSKEAGHVRVDGTKYAVQDDTTSSIPSAVKSSKIKTARKYQRGSEIIFDSPATNMSLTSPAANSLASAIIATPAVLQSPALEDDISDSWEIIYTASPDYVSDYVSDYTSLLVRTPPTSDSKSPKIVYLPYNYSCYCALPSRTLDIFHKMGTPALLALTSLMGSTTVFSYVLCPQEYIFLPAHIPEYGDAFAVVAMILGPLVRMVMGYVCGEMVRNIAWVVLWACVGRAQTMTESDSEPLILIRCVNQKCMIAVHSIM